MVIVHLFSTYKVIFVLSGRSLDTLLTSQKSNTSSACWDLDAEVQRVLGYSSLSESDVQLPRVHLSLRVRLFGALVYKLPFHPALLLSIQDPGNSLTIQMIQTMTICVLFCRSSEIERHGLYVASCHFSLVLKVLLLFCPHNITS
jgi:hypothetical protein